MSSFCEVNVIRRRALRVNCCFDVEFTEKITTGFLPFVVLCSRMKMLPFPQYGVRSIAIDMGADAT